MQQCHRFLQSEKSFRRSAVGKMNYDWLLSQKIKRKFLVYFSGFITIHSYFITMIFITVNHQHSYKYFKMKFLRFSSLFKLWKYHYSWCTYFDWTSSKIGVKMKTLSAFSTIFWHLINKSLYICQFSWVYGLTFNATKKN